MILSRSPITEQEREMRMNAVEQSALTNRRRNLLDPQVLFLQKHPSENFLKNLDREFLTQREFLRQLAAQAGFSLDWRRVGREAMTAASRESFSTGDNGSMTDIIRTCTR